MGGRGRARNSPWAGHWDGSASTESGTPSVTGTFASISCPDARSVRGRLPGNGDGKALIARRSRLSAQPAHPRVSGASPRSSPSGSSAALAAGERALERLEVAGGALARVVAGRGRR